MRSYREWALDAELVLQMSFVVDDIVHVRFIDTGELLCGQQHPRLEYLRQMPARREQLPSILHSDCRGLIPD